MNELIQYLNARTVEYDSGKPTISDQEWDKKYFELVKMEKDTGTILDNSPTQKIHFQVVSQLDKAQHNHPMLSLEKTKDIEEIKQFIGERPFIAMCKMDGLTCSLSYSNGRLVTAETRGDGTIGENILHNARVLESIPNRIPILDDVTIDGEIICSFEDFEEFKDDYKNPRNFAAGSIRLLDSSECSKRKLQFVAWDVIQGGQHDLLHKNLNDLLGYGFTIVPFSTDLSIEETLEWIEHSTKKMSYPTDGIVFKFDEVSYGKSLGQTSHHFKNAMAFKFFDEAYVTYLRDIEWTMGRTGALTPVAVFDPVDADGSTIERASMHNISVMESLLGSKPHKGQELSVAKRNMIIPQIESAVISSSEDVSCLGIPEACPVCGHSTSVVISTSGVQLLVCDNPVCDGKIIGRLDHFCGIKGLDIKGLSRSAFDKLTDWGWLNSISDVFELHTHRTEWVSKPGFGAKSVDKILDAIEKAKTADADKFVAAIGIPLVGSTLSKQLFKQIKDYPAFRDLIKTGFDFTSWNGIGEEIHSSLHRYDYTEADSIYEKYLTLTNPCWINSDTSNKLEGRTIVITGKLIKHRNRNELQAVIERHGGKVAGSISSKTTCLINNDNASMTAKNLEAKKNGIPILTEESFLKLYRI